jgi:hypothetical protein
MPQVNNNADFAEDANKSSEELIDVSGGQWPKMLRAQNDGVWIIVINTVLNFG